MKGKKNAGNCKYKEIDFGIDEITGKRGTEYLLERGPGTLCYFYIIIIILGTITSLSYPPDEIKEDKKATYYIVELIYGIFASGFMYYMCYMCRGFLGFIMVVIFSSLNRALLIPALYK